MNNKFVALVSLLGVTALLGACGPAVQQDTTPTPAPTVTPTEPAATPTVSPTP